MGPWTKPRAPLPLLTAGLTERSPPHQWCPGVSPTVRMGMAPVIVFDIPEQSRLEICHRSEIASLQEPPSEHAEPEFHLVEPGSMDRGEMEHMLVGWVRQKGAPLFACLQDRRFERDGGTVER